MPEKEEFEEVPMSEIQKIFETQAKATRKPANCGAAYKSCVDNATGCARFAEPRCVFHT